MSQFIFSENNYINYAHLIKEWAASNIKSIYDYSYGSAYLATWECQQCNSLFKSSIIQRTSKNTKCPFCTNQKVNHTNSLKTTHPQLEIEFLHDKNKILFSEMHKGSRLRVWWKCFKCQKEIFISVKDKLRIKSEKCRHQKFHNKNIKGRSLLDGYNLLCDKWNNSNIDINSITYGSEYLATWNCFKCNSKYLMKVCKRAVDNHGCPYCAGKKVNETNNAFNIYPYLKPLLSNNQNHEEINLTIGSVKKIIWNCKICFFDYKMSIYGIIKCYKNKFKGCPYCTGKKANFNNCVSSNLSLFKEWDFDKNKISPDKVTKVTNKKFYWICKDCKYSWRASPDSRNLGTGCPHCCHKISKPEITWLNSLNIRNRQVKLKINNKLFKVDGFDFISNTIYEFYGDYYHGNPNIYDPNELNLTCKKTFGELYIKTMKRENLIKNAGYNLITIWESDFKKLLYKGKMYNK